MRRLVLITASAMLPAGAGLVPASAAAAPYVLPVTTQVDESLGENEELCGGTEECPLRAALEQAKRYLGLSATSITIAVPAGHYSLEKGPLAIGDTAPECEVAVKCPITLQGAGAAATVISGRGGSATGRLLTAPEGAAAITIAGVTL